MLVMCITAGIACGRQVRERHTKLEEFAIWLASLMRVQAQEQQRQQQEETAVALWDMYLAYGGKPGSDQQERFDEMKEDSAVFQKVHSRTALYENAVTALQFVQIPIAALSENAVTATALMQIPAAAYVCSHS